MNWYSGALLLLCNHLAYAVTDLTHHSGEQCRIFSCLYSCEMKWDKPWQLIAMTDLLWSMINKECKVYYTWDLLHTLRSTVDMNIWSICILNNWWKSRENIWKGTDTYRLVTIQMKTLVSSLHLHIIQVLV